MQAGGRLVYIVQQWNVSFVAEIFTRMVGWMAAVQGVPFSVQRASNDADNDVTRDVHLSPALSVITSCGIYGRCPIVGSPPSENLPRPTIYQQKFVPSGSCPGGVDFCG